MIKSRPPVQTVVQDGNVPSLVVEHRQSNPGALQVLWGRRSQVSTVSAFLSLIFMLTAQIFILFAQVCMDSFDGSVTRGARELLSAGSPTAFLRSYLSTISKGPVAGFIAWVTFQALLYTFLPGRITLGPPTPSGLRLPYRINGLLSWFLTIGLWFGVLCTKGAEAASAPARNFTMLIVSGNIYGLMIAVLALLKGYLFPGANGDRRFSGSVVHDFLAGVELNPRVGRYWDVKMFQIGRLGMNSWVVMYLSTIDIAHDHFGFYLGWGAAVWLPVVYTMQAQYLASHFIQLSSLSLCAILTAGILSYVVFRLSNHQKYSLRQNGEGACRIWGAPPRVIRAKYATADGKRHESTLLYSGEFASARNKKLWLTGGSIARLLGLRETP
ncbi:hypothetical protein QQS21_002062 [Conoideocrella luteorostrata]|uniref:7-dehydrocholesterol reductase n=1 Tax=Conoideocrella luteorostrata TaxID=1105319 RepID=A0AAJ0G353_9HYPO|nr:hypothetical protein QQS21_002062 [Conoideocrella luteorostrata]